MLKILRLSIIFSWISMSCNIQNGHDVKTKNTDNNYPKYNLDFLEEIAPKNDTLIYRAKVEINLDSNQVSSWRINGDHILRSQLLSKLEEIQLAYPKERSRYFSIDLGIDKKASIQEFTALRDSLRIGNYLRASLLNSNNQRLSVRFPLSHKMNPSKFFPIPSPPPPPIEELICLCCEEKGKFRTSGFNHQAESFESYFDCMKGSNLNESYTYVHIEEDKFYWEGNEFSLSTIRDSLHFKYANYPKPNRFVTILKIDSLSNFESYFNLHAVCRKIYVDKWNEESLKMFESPYKDLPKNDKRKIRAQYPLILAQYFD